MYGKAWWRGIVRAAAGPVLGLFLWGGLETVGHRCPVHTPQPAAHAGHYGAHSASTGSEHRPSCCCVGRCCPAPAIAAAPVWPAFGTPATGRPTSPPRPVEAWPTPPSELLPYATAPPSVRLFANS